MVNNKLLDECVLALARYGATLSDDEKRLLKKVLVCDEGGKPSTPAERARAWEIIVYQKRVEPYQT
jgi:hypothetical protein